MMSEGQPVFEVSEASVTFGGNKALDSVSFSMTKGQLIGLIAVSYTHLTLPTNREV